MKTRTDILLKITQQFPLLRCLVLSIFLFSFISKTSAQEETDNIPKSVDSTLTATDSIQNTIDSLSTTADTTPTHKFGFDDLAGDEEVLAGYYVQPRYDDPIIEIGSRFLYPYTSINQYKDDHVNFTTGTQTFLSANLYWKWLAVGYDYPLADYTHGYSFRFSPLIKNINFDFNIIKIKKYSLISSSNIFKNNFDEKEFADIPQDSLSLDGLETFQWKLNVEWILNKTFFSSNTAFSQSYSGGQRVSAGSWIVGATVGEDRFLLNPSNSRSTIANEALSHLPMQNNKIFSLSVGCGHGYNFVVRQGKLVIGALLVPYFTIADAYYKYEGENIDKLCYGMRTHGRYSIVYQYYYGFVGLSLDFRGLFYYDGYFSYTQYNTTVSLNVALKLGSFGIHTDRVPGHKTLDFIGRIL